LGCFLKTAPRAGTRTVRKFYNMGSTTVAVRTVSGTEDVLNWVLGNHYGAQRSTPEAQRRGPGSTSVTANADGSWKSEIEYCEASPKQSAGDTVFGEIRASDGITPTEYRYTNQLNQSSLGLYFYVARWYDPALSHFVQADTRSSQDEMLEAYNRALEISEKVLSLDQSEDITNGAIRWSDRKTNR
jgi:RHS repeat-associated protein